MNKQIMLYSCFILAGTFISSIAQILLKKSSQIEYSSKIKEYLNPYVIVGYGIFFGATLFSVFAYKVVPLSYGPILEATGFIYVTIFGAIFFKEKINLKKVVALSLIILGIYIFAFGEKFL